MHTHLDEVSSSEENLGAKSESLVYVVDDEDGCRLLIQSLVENAGLHVQSFSSAKTFLNVLIPDQAGCIIVDYKMPEMSGIDLIKQVRSIGCPTPFVVVTGFGTVPITVEFMKLGAVTVLEKPFHYHQLMDCVRWAISLDESERQKASKRASTVALTSRLTARELDVLDLAREGKSSKQIAIELKISIKTVEVHRSNIVRKMEVDSMVHLLSLLMFESSSYCNTKAESKPK